MPGAPRVDVVGLGPAGPDLITAGTSDILAAADLVFLRTARHPAADAVERARTFDHHYETADTFDDVYRAIVADLVDAARTGATVAYAVPGSPTVAERTVVLLAGHPSVVSGEVTVVVHPSVSFLDIAFARLGVDPVDAGVRLVDAERFALDAAGERGPLLVAQCWNRQVLSDVKLSVDTAPGAPVTVLHHLGLPDERIDEVAWADLDRSFEPDHLTSLWIPQLGAPVAAELVALDELVRTLRARCPWDRRQTHASLGRHLLEESYEVLEAIDEVTAADGEADREADGDRVADREADGDRVADREADRVADRVADGAIGRSASEVTDRGAAASAHLEEELGDLLFQVYFHATLAAESGRFTLADVARGVHDKLVARHPHVFGGVTAETADDVAVNWEAIKKAEKGRSSVTEGIPAALPALALAAKLQRKATAIGMVLPGLADEAARVADGVARLGALDDEGPEQVADGEGGARARADEIGELLFAAVGVARALGVDPETALLSRARTFRSEVETRG